jgi:hypothetical protein
MVVQHVQHDQGGAVIKRLRGGLEGVPWKIHSSSSSSNRACQWLCCDYETVYWAYGSPLQAAAAAVEAASAAATQHVGACAAWHSHCAVGSRVPCRQQQLSMSENVKD